MHQASFEKIRLVLLDVDGVLSDSQIFFNADGEALKSFNVRDGLGIVLLQKHNISVGVITGRSSPALTRRLQDLHIDLVYQNTHDKMVAYEEILTTRQLKDEQVAYMGDDLTDLCILRRCGLPAAPADAVPEVLQVAKFVSVHWGGHGAVRELAEEILKAQNAWAY